MTSSLFPPLILLLLLPLATLPPSLAAYFFVPFVFTSILFASSPERSEEKIKRFIACEMKMPVILPAFTLHF